ncbi:2-dehydro-3-deoxy-6-phosphogalactonate aldolase [Parvularcula marina]|uniref:2-dehydro-3-deoxy-6-phosphogalactonate aldolase n=1 Tax=Parvularcula marina TaxID=2292771 RepID=UPI0035138B6D
MLVDRLKEHMVKMPIVAILRGVTPSEVEDVAAALIENGVGIIEVPLNSPSAFESIEKLADRFGEVAIIGAGTVLTVSDAERVAACGGQIAVAPNTNPEVIKAVLSRGMIPMPGIFTPTDAFAAIEAGAEVLKLFPAGTIGEAGLKAMMAVLPEDISVLAVGGVGAGNIQSWFDAGAAGFGIGSELYKPGDTPEQVAQKTAALVVAVETLQRGN